MTLSALWIMNWRSRPEIRVLMRSSWKNPGNSVAAQNMMMAAQMESGGWLREIYGDGMGRIWWLVGFRKRRKRSQK